jgi:hypothetical protein
MEELKKRQIQQLLKEIEREILGGEFSDEDCSAIIENIQYEHDLNTEQSGLSSDEENSFLDYIIQIYYNKL